MSLKKNMRSMADQPLTYNGYSFIEIRSLWNGTAKDRNLSFSLSHLSSIPNGYAAPTAWVLAQSSGGMAVYTGMIGNGSAVSNLVGGKNGTITTTGAGRVSNASLSLLTYAAATLAGLGRVSNANLAGKATLVATLAGHGRISAALGALANMTKIINGQGSMTGTPYAKAYMSATIYFNQSQASSAQVATEVWNSVATNFNNNNTMGKLQNKTAQLADDNQALIIAGME
jgi:hypothetical protein